MLTKDKIKGFLTPQNIYLTIITILVLFCAVQLAWIQIQYKYFNANEEFRKQALNKYVNTQLQLKDRISDLEAKEKASQYKIREAYEHVLHTMFFEELGNKQTYLDGKYKLQYSFQSGGQFCYDFYICNGIDCQMHPDSETMACINSNKELTDFHVDELLTKVSKHPLIVINYEENSWTKQEMLLPYDCNSQICYEQLSNKTKISADDKYQLDSFEISTNATTGDLEVKARLYNGQSGVPTIWRTYTLTEKDGMIIVSIG